MGTIRSFRRTAGSEEHAARNLAIALVIGTLPAVVVGFAGGAWLESLYENPRESAIEDHHHGGSPALDPRDETQGAGASPSGDRS